MAGQSPLFAAHPFFAALKEDLNLLRTDEPLHETEAENRMLYEFADLAGRVHGIIRCLRTVHAWPQVFPLFAGDGFRVNGSSQRGLSGCGGRPILVLTFARAALHLDRGLFRDGDNDVGCILAAFGATGFDRIAGRKHGALHSVTPLFEISQDMADKNQGDVWNLRNRPDHLAGLKYPSRPHGVFSP
jgi:hypothetical protein